MEGSEPIKLPHVNVEAPFQGLLRGNHVYASSRLVKLVHGMEKYPLSFLSLLFHFFMSIFLLLILLFEISKN